VTDQQPQTTVKKRRQRKSNKFNMSQVTT